MHMDHAIEMIELIIKDTDLDPYAEQMMEKLEASVYLTFLGYVLFSNFLLLLFIHWLVVVLL